MVNFKELTLLVVSISEVLWTVIAWTEAGGAPNSIITDTYSKDIVKAIDVNMSSALTFYEGGKRFLWVTDEFGDYTHESNTAVDQSPSFPDSYTIAGEFQMSSIKYAVASTNVFAISSLESTHSKQISIFDPIKRTPFPLFMVEYLEDVQPQEPLLVEGSNYVVIGAAVRPTQASLSLIKNCTTQVVCNIGYFALMINQHVVKADYTARFSNESVIYTSVARVYSSINHIEWRDASVDNLAKIIYYGGPGANYLEAINLPYMYKIKTVSFGDIGSQLTGVEITDDALLIAIGVKDYSSTKLKILSCSTNQELRVFPIDSSSPLDLVIKAMSFSHLILGRVDTISSIYIWNIDNQNYIQTKTDTTKFIQSIGIDNKRRFLVPLSKVLIISVCSSNSSENIAGLDGCGKCIMGTYFDPTTVTCIPCHSSCQGCITGESYSCTSCTAPFVLNTTNNPLSINGTCEIHCNSGTYVYMNTSCQTCYYTCKECINGTSSGCTSCKVTYLFFEGQCVKSCIPGTFEINNTCQKCDPTCKECVSGSRISCISCREDSFMMYSSEKTGSCDSTCPSGTYAEISSRSCKNCDTSCSECIDFGPKACSKCRFPNVLVIDECLESCPSKMYKSDSYCFYCDPICNECKAGTSSDCTSCLTGQFLFNGKCFNTCPFGTYENSGNCYKCDPSCQECFGIGINSCNSCAGTKMLANNTCLDVCPDGSYGSANICWSCHESCSTCSREKDTDCLSCTNNLFFYLRRCLQNCPASTYASKGTCNECHISCKECFGDLDTQCSACSTPFYLQEYSCLRECSKGYTLINQVCYPCDNNCQTCEPGHSQTCLSCPQNHVLYKGRCLLECPIKTYQDYEIGVCKDCNQSCGSCSSAHYCESCDLNSTNVFFFNSACLEFCPSSTYNIGNICKMCSPGCKECIDDKQCLKCEPKSNKPILYNSSCLSILPERVYFDDEFNSYQDCNNEKKFTIIPESCNKICNTPQVLYLGKCLEQCPKDYMNNASECKEIKGFKYLSFRFIEDRSSYFESNYDAAFKIQFIDIQINRTLDNSTAALIQINDLDFEVKADSKNIGIKIVKKNEEFFGLLNFSNLTSEDTELIIILKDDLIDLKELLVIKEGVQKIHIEIPLFPSEQTKGIISKSRIGLSNGNTATTGLEIASIGTLIFNFDPSGVLMRIPLSAKLFSRLSLIDVYYGSLLDPILLQASTLFSKSSQSENDSVRIMENGWKGRLSKANITLRIVSKLSYKILLYLIAWVLRLAVTIVWKHIADEDVLSPTIVRLIYYEKRIHFVAFTLIVSDGVFLIARALLHGKICSLETNISFLILVLLIIDFLLLFKDINEVDERSEFNHKKREEFREKIDRNTKESNKSEISTMQDPTIEQDIELPMIIPVAWVSEKEAIILGYKLYIDYEYMRGLVEFDEAVFNFRSISLNQKKVYFYIWNLFYIS